MTVTNHTAAAGPITTRHRGGSNTRTNTPTTSATSSTARSGNQPKLR